MELHPTVISSHFWPSMQTTQVTLPPRLQAYVVSAFSVLLLMLSSSMQDKYSHEFHLFKPDKRLHWLPLMGYVRIEVELEDRIIDKECSPLAAAVIELFLDIRASRHAL
jgi:anaphase-promoting complex subunit 2